MPVFKDYAENGELLGIRTEILNEKNFERYKTENSIDHINGYADALEDVLNYFKQNLSLSIGLKQNLNQFWQERQDFLNTITTLTNK